MNLKLRLKLSDILKLIFGADVMILDQYNGSILRVQRGEDTGIYKGQEGE